MKNKCLLSFFIVLLLFFLADFPSVSIARADGLSEIIAEQSDNIALSEIEDFFNDSGEGFDFIGVFKNLLNGKYDGANGFTDYIRSVVFNDFLALLPGFIAIILIVLIYEILNGLKSSALTESASAVVKFASVSSVVLILGYELFSIYTTCRALIENIGIFCELVSPVLLTLMTASSGITTAAIFKPSVLFFTNSVIGIFGGVVLPIVGVMLVFNFASHIAKDLKLKRFNEFFASVIKWIIGITAFVYGFIVTVQGMSVSGIDGISVRVAKYAVSNSIPLVGGLIKDGIDIVTAGSVVIKNALGIAGVVGLFYILLSPLLKIIAFSVLLKLTAALTGFFPDGSV
ncbi:MAG: stage III sporulation protein AE, partial [Clostridia bacterium]|nr:stage III sporulation protein AE [Clostridia bacterium]